MSNADIKAGSSLKVSLIRVENFLWISSNSSTYCCGPWNQMQNNKFCSMVSKLHTVWIYMNVLKHFLLSLIHCTLCSSLTFSTLTDLIAWRPKKTKLKNYMFFTGSLECCVSHIISVMRIWSPTRRVIVKACHDIHVQKASREKRDEILRDTRCFMYCRIN